MKLNPTVKPPRMQRETKLDDYSYKQLKRNIRQQEVMKMVCEIIKHGQGN